MILQMETYDMFLSSWIIRFQPRRSELISANGARECLLESIKGIRKLASFLHY